MLVSAVASILPFALELLLVTTQSPSAVALQFLYISLARKLGINQQLLPLPFSPLPRLPDQYTVSLRVGSVLVLVVLYVSPVLAVVQFLSLSSSSSPLRYPGPPLAASSSVSSPNEISPRQVPPLLPPATPSLFFAFRPPVSTGDIPIAIAFRRVRLSLCLPPGYYFLSPSSATRLHKSRSTRSVAPPTSRQEHPRLSRTPFAESLKLGKLPTRSPQV